MARTQLLNDCAVWRTGGAVGAILNYLALSRGSGSVALRRPKARWRLDATCPPTAPRRGRHTRTSRWVWVGSGARGNASGSRS